MDVVDDLPAELGRRGAKRGERRLWHCERSSAGEQSAGARLRGVSERSRLQAEIRAVGGPARSAIADRFGDDTTQTIDGLASPG